VTDPAPAHPPPPAAGWRARTPNALTVARLLMTAAFVALLALEPGSAATLWAAFALFVVAGATDALDGYLARRWNAVSVFGRVADPLADKLLILGAFVMLAGDAFPRSPIDPWMTVVVLARELLVTTLRGAMEGRGVDFGAGPTGKLKMILQWALLTLALADAALAAGTADTPEPQSGLVVLAWATVAFTAYSGWPYVSKAINATTRMRS